jgi:XTP/dITP diphosphohydrolase
MPRLCFATNNAHKLEEIQALLGQDFELLTLKDINCNEELPETGDTLEANSLQKTQYLFDNYGVNCFGDDSGLEVEALNGEPGVYSAHYAGEQRNADDNMNLLLEKLGDNSNKKAQFKSVITLIQDGKITQFEGSVEGEIIAEKRGNQGFGYDPIFIPENLGRTFAEMSLAEKSTLSHRARAFAKLVEFLKK